MAKKENAGQYQKVADLLKEITSLTNTLNLSEESRVDLEQQILDGKIKTLGAMQKAVDQAVKQEAQLRVQIKAEQEISKEKERQNQLADVNKKLQRDLAAQKFDLVGFGQSQRDLAKEALQADRKAIAIALKHGDINQDEAFILREKLLEREKEIATMERASDIAQSANEEVQAIFNDAQGEVSNLLGSLPGGATMAKMLGFDEAFDMLRTAGTQAVNAVTQSMLAGQGPMAALKAGQAAFNQVAMMNPYVAIIASVVILIALVGKLIGMAHEQTKLALEQAEAQGVSVNKAREQVIAANEAMASQRTMLADAKEILAVQNEINSALGASHSINAENAAVIADIGESMGYGAKTAGESAAALMHLGASAAEAASIQEEANLEAVKAGVDMGAVQKDIAKNAGTVSKYFAGNPKALAKAAIEAQKMGMSIEKMAKVSDGLLNIENSLQAQFEFQAFTGKQINMEKARQLALEGDIAGATKEVMNQIGDIHDFEKMNMKQREKLAAMVGMEVGELEKSLALQEKRGNMTDEELAAVSGLGLSMAEINSMSADDLKKRAQQAQATEAMNMQFQKMKQTVLNALQPIFDLVQILMTVLMPIFKVLGLTLKLAFLPIKIAFGIIKAMLDPVMELFNSFSGGGDIIAGISDGLDFIADLIIQIGGFIGKFITWPFKLFKFVVDLIRDNIDAIKDVLVKIGKFIFDYITAPFRFAIVIIKSIGQFLWDLVTAPADAWSNFVENIKAGANSIFEFVKAPFQWIMDKINSLIDGAKKVANVLSFGLLGGDDEEEPEKMAGGGIAKGGTTLVGEHGPELVNMPGGARVTQAGPTGGILSSLGDMASSAMSMTPMGMAANAIGGLFGGGDEGGSGGEQVELLRQILAAVQQPPPVVIGDGQVAQISTKISAQKSFKK